MIGISACLAGVYCRYDGGSQTKADLLELVAKGEALMVCPEVMGGLPIPRTPAEIVGGDGFAVWDGQAKVVDKTGIDVTEAFKKGSQKAYQEMQKLGITQLILKERSPSCGSSQIYDGSFSGNKTTGVGVATAYFIKQGMTIFNEESYHELMKDNSQGALNGN